MAGKVLEQLVELRGVDHDPRVSNPERVFTAVEGSWPGWTGHGVAAGVRQGTPDYLEVVWVPWR